MLLGFFFNPILSNFISKTDEHQVNVITQLNPLTLNPACRRDGENIKESLKYYCPDFVVPKNFVAL